MWRKQEFQSSMWMPSCANHTRRNDTMKLQLDLAVPYVHQHKAGGTCMPLILLLLQLLQEQPQHLHC